MLRLVSEPFSLNAERLVLADLPNWLNNWEMLYESSGERIFELVHEKPEKAFEALFSYFIPIEAAGGWVQNSFNQNLFIHRLGFWDLPKGKIEKNETPEIAAIREVMEEVGLEGLKIIAPLPKTYHTYQMHGNRVLKTTHWFKMQTQYTGLLKPQVEEDITEAVWLDYIGIKMALLQTYPAIKQLAKAMGIDIQD